MLIFLQPQYFLLKWLMAKRKIVGLLDNWNIISNLFTFARLVFTSFQYLFLPLLYCRILQLKKYLQQENKLLKSCLFGPESTENPH